MERRVEITGYWIIGTNMVFGLGIIFLEPAFLVRMLLLCMWLSLECYLTSKFFFNYRKMKLRDAENEKKYHSIKYIFSEEINPKIRKYFSVSELFQVEIAENKTDTYRFKIERILLGEMLIEDLNYMRDLFQALKENGETLKVTKSGLNSYNEEDSADSLMKKYEEILYKGKLHKYYFVYTDSQKKVTKLVHIEKDGAIKICFLAAEKRKIEDRILKAEY